MRSALTFSFALLLTLPSAARAESRLERDFQTPPHAARLQACWFWVDSHFSKAGITKDLEAMLQHGEQVVDSLAIDTPFKNGDYCLNGSDPKVLWYAPYQADVTRLLRAGENELEIAVTVNRANAPIGDEKIPADFTNGRFPSWLGKGQPRPSARRTYTTFNPGTILAGADEPPGGETAPLATFAERRRAILETFGSSGNERFMQAECLFALGKTREALAAVNKGLDALEPGNQINRWMHGGNTGFIAWPGIDCYIRFERQMDAATKERYRRIYTGGVFYAKLSTSNHKLMAAVSRYLATQVWGADSFKADPYFMEKDPYIQEMTAKMNKPGSVWGTHYGKGDPTGEVYLREIIAATVKGGPGEYASRPYGAQNILPLLSIADCATDPAMAGQARIAYEVSLLQLALAWQRGHLATFAPRSYPDTESQRPWGVAVLPWLYFGGMPPELSKARAATQAAVSTYRVPEMFNTMATDRAKPYFHRARINGWALNHYTNRGYSLFSRSAKIGGKPWQGQSYPCGVMWEEPDPARGSHLWITNPAADEPGAMGLHTHGVRPFEQEVLARDSLLFVFQIEPDNKFPYGLGYLPGGHDAFLNESGKSGRIFLHYGSALIAITATQPFPWDPAAGILAPAAKARPGDSEFRIKSASFAVAIETAPPEEFPGATPAAQLAAFRDALTARSALKLIATSPVTASYQNRHGDHLEGTFNGADRVNGVELDYKAWPASESPWTSQRLPTSPLEVTDGKRVRTYDFATWTVTEREAPPAGQ